MLFEDDLGHVNRFTLSDSVPEDADDILEPDPVLIVDTLEEDLKVINDVLLEDELVDFAVNLDELLKTHLLLISEDLLQHLGPDCDLVHA